MLPIKKDLVLFYRSGGYFGEVDAARIARILQGVLIQISNRNEFGVSINNASPGDLEAMVRASIDMLGVPARVRSREKIWYDIVEQVLLERGYGLTKPFPHSYRVPVKIIFS